MVYPSSSVKTVLVTFLLATLVQFSSHLFADELELISIDSSGVQGSTSSTTPFISSNGRFVTFVGSSLVPGDGSATQVYLRDRQLETTELISMNNTGDVADTTSSLPRHAGGRGVTDYGRFVVFRSAATNLPDTGANPTGIHHIYVRDRQLATTILISKTSDGTPANGTNATDFAIAPDGWGVLFNTFANNLDPLDPDSTSNTYLHELAAETTKLACFNTFGEKINNCTNLTLSCTGVMAFESAAPNVAPDDTHTGLDVFRGIPLFGTNKTLSLAIGGATGSINYSSASISCDGNRVAFASLADLTLEDQMDGVVGEWDTYVFDETTAITWLVRPLVGMSSVSPEASDIVLSPSGRWLALFTNEQLDPVDTNTRFDIYAHHYNQDRVIGGLSLVSQSAGQASNSNPTQFPSIADTGASVFYSAATNFIPGGDVNFAWDVFAGDDAIFTDGFESGDVSLWSSSSP